MRSEFRKNIQAYERGAADERERIRAIMNLPETVGREGAALHCALSADLPIESIAFILANAPAGPKNTFNVRIAIPEHARLNTSIPLEDIIDEILR